MRYENGFITLVAPADIPADAIVSLNGSGQAVTASANDAAAIGVCEEGAASGTVACVRLFNAGGTVEVLASGSITAGAAVSVAASGTVAARVTTSGSETNLLGYAMAAAASGDLVQIIPQPSLK